MVNQKLLRQNLSFKNLLSSLLLSCLVINFTMAGLWDRLGCRRPAPKSRGLAVTPSGEPEFKCVDATANTSICCTKACRGRIKAGVIVASGATGSMLLTEQVFRNFVGNSYVFNVDGSVSRSTVCFTVSMTLLGYIQAQARIKELDAKIAKYSIAREADSL